MTDPQQDQTEQSIEFEADQTLAEILRDPSVPELYCNGFFTFLAPADVFLLLQRNGLPVAKLNLSYTTAKTLAQRLAQIVADLEQDSGAQIMTMDQVPGPREAD